MNLNHTEIELIKSKLQNQFASQLLMSLWVIIPACLIAPYFPNKGRKLIDKMEYIDALILFSLFMAVILLIITIQHRYKTNKKLEELRPFLKKTKVTAKVKTIRKGFFNNYKKEVITNLKNEFRVLKIEQDIINKLNINDQIEIEFEKQTKTILKIEKIRN